MAPFKHSFRSVKSLVSDSKRPATIRRRLRKLRSRPTICRSMGFLCAFFLAVVEVIPTSGPRKEHISYRNWMDAYQEFYAKLSTDADWELPPHIHATYKIRRDSPEVKEMVERDWTRPLVFLHYARPYPNNRKNIELFIYATGVRMGKFNRGFEVVGCLVGQDVYPCHSLKGDVFQCQVKRPIKQGELISLVLRRNEHVDEQLRERTVRIHEHLNVTLEEGDLIPLPNDTCLQFENSESDVEQFLFVNSEQRFEALGDGLDPNTKDSKPRYEVCLATQIKPFTNYLDDWIAYYKRVGVDMFFIIDNDADENLDEMYKDRWDVQVMYWPWHRSQTQALSYLLMASRSRCEWIMFADVDEYAMLGMGKNRELVGKQVLRKYLRRRLNSKYKQFMFWWLNMQNSGYVNTPDEPLPEAYIHMAEKQLKTGKSFARTDHWWLKSLVHMCGGFSYANAPVDLSSTHLYRPVDEDDQPIMVHYRERSLEDFVIKKQYGSNSPEDAMKNSDEMVMILKRARQRFAEVDDSFEYTYFRDIYRAIMQEPFEFKQSLVRRANGSRCIARRKATKMEVGVILAERCDTSLQIL